MDARAARGLALALILATSACMPAALAPTSIEIEPGTVTFSPGDSADFSALVHGGVAFAQDRVRWSVAPTRLGTIDPSGHFVASERTGAGIVTATLGALSASVEIGITCPTTRTVKGFSLNARCASAADVYTDSRIKDEDVETAVMQIRDDVIALESELGRKFTTRALVYVFADASAMRAALRAMVSGSAAAQVDQSDAMFIPRVDAVFADWSSIARSRPITALRHELVHRLVWEITGFSTRAVFDGIDKSAHVDLPMWLDEGLATVEESTVPGAEWLAEKDRVFAAAAYPMASLTLSDLVSMREWLERTGPNSYYQYVFAAQAVRQLRTEVGAQGILRILDRVRDGASFADAYKATSGFPLTSFTSRYGSRLRGGVQTMPGVIGIHSEGRAGLVLYGFTPNATLTLSFAGPTTTTTSTETDEYGNDFFGLGSSYAAGTYTLSVSAAKGGAKTFTIVK